MEKKHFEIETLVSNDVLSQDMMEMVVGGKGGSVAENSDCSNLTVICGVNCNNYGSCNCLNKFCNNFMVCGTNCKTFGGLCPLESL